MSQATDPTAQGRLFLALETEDGNWTIENPTGQAYSISLSDYDSDSLERIPLEAWDVLSSLRCKNGPFEDWVIINVGDIMSPDAHSGTHTFNFVMKRAEAGDIPDRASDSSDSSQGSDASTSSKPMERVPAARAVSDPHHKSPMEPGATGTTPPKQAKGSQSHIPALNIGKPKSPMFEPESEDEDTETPQLPTTPHSQTPESASPNPKPENQEPKAVAPVLEAPGPVVHDDEADDELASKTITLTLSGTGAAGDRPTL